MKHLPSTYRPKGSLTLSVILLSLYVSTSLSAEAGSNTPAGSGNRKLLLFAKNPVSWAVVKGGASGSLIYRESTGAFTFNAVRLHPRSAYVLVRYADTPPNGDVLAKGISDEHGRLELNGVWRNWTKKFWLVAAEDVAGKVGESGTLIAWRPDRYLFEEKQLGIACACPEQEEP